MRILSFIILCVLPAIYIFPQSPHGNKLKVDCADCHEATNWKIIPSNIKFDHNKETAFELIGQHKTLSCRSCHKSLVFSEARSSCNSCHQDVHQNTLGQNCSTCHSPSTWIISNIKEIHDRGRFPLLGAHINADCSNCHQGYSKLYFPPQSVSCFSCHSKQYYGAVSPNHVQAKFSTECQDCHNVSSLTWAAQNFNHSFFPLVGGHKIQNCFSCHKQGNNFKGLSTDCYSCHQQNYLQAKNPDHVQAKFSTACQDCHNINSFIPAVFDHNTTGFQLTGRHTSVSCQSCHNNGYINTPTDCYSCHSSDYSKATDPNHASQGFPHDCSLCHTTSGWGDANFNHSTTGFVLTAGHANVSCSSCHAAGYINTSPVCSSCHQQNYQTAANPNHTALALPSDCSSCHTTNPGWKPAIFPIHGNYYQLVGAHATIANSCDNCHNGNYNTAPNTCYGCHQSNYQSAANPNHQSAGLPQSCQDCHTSTAWIPSSFNHSTTGFALTGAHTSLDCSSCHKGTVKGSSPDCISCHQSNYNTAPNHTAQNYPTDCTMCHTTSAWSPSSFNHNNTPFPLTGAHTTVDCSSCHKTGFTGTPTDCYSCHSSDYAKTTDPNHAAQNFPHDCTQCHSTTSWGDANFDHSTTGFALTAGHANIACSSCHASGYVNTSPVCSSCHQQNYQTAANPNHTALGMPQSCQDCHTTNPGWKPATFPIHGNYYQLVGAHAAIANSCDNCHNGNYNTAPNTCYGCHQSSYQSAANPNHQSAGLPQSCQDCHTSTAWIPSSFNHSTTGFALTGAHTSLDCSSCHKGTVKGSSPDCISCHQSNYNTAPNHTAQNYPTDCTMCHTTNAWSPSSFNHNNTAFPLTGAHTTVDCSSCHKTGFTGTPTDCYSCHSSDYAKTTDPNHAAQNYPHDCTQCHSTTSWGDANFDHSTTGFALTAGHANLTCASCHTSGYTNTSPVCSSCHQSNYQTAANPNHTALALPSDCSSCHTTNPGWKPATFPIHGNYYQLVGAHAAIANSCDNCHNGNYNTAPNTCYGCHQNDYNSTTNPAHQSAGFPTDCTECHSQTAWQPSTFDHDNKYFPIYSGSHAGRWNLCSDCHTSSSNFAVFSCITCHEHSQANTDSHHSDVRNYVYSPTSCYSCHPTGRAGD